MNDQANRPLTMTLCLFLIAFGAFFRVVRLEFFPGFQNFAPLMAIACCGALFLPGWLALAAPLGALVISDVLLDLHYGHSFFSWEVWPRYVCFALAVASGFWARRLNGATLPIFGIVAANSIFFYLFSNACSWIGDPGYSKTFAGLLQALTIGLPGYAPTWTFLRFSLISDLLFTALFLGAFHLATRANPAQTAVARA